MHSTELPSQLFSVIVPTYNRNSTIIRALESVVKQTYRPIQLIIVDDGSTDETFEIIKNWKKSNENPELTVEYIYQKNSGASSARNTGIKSISGEFVQFLDSDDILHPKRIEILVTEFKKGADFIHTGFARFEKSEDNIIQKFHGNTNIELKSQVIQGRAWLNTIRDALTVELLYNTGTWNEDFICFEDREFMERAALRSQHPTVIKEVLSFAEVGEYNRTSNKQKTKEGRRLRIICEYNIVKEIRRNEFIGTQLDKSLLKSRLYGLAFRTKASGWYELAKNCYELANSINANLNYRGIRRKLIYHTGYIGTNVILSIAKFLK